MEFIAFSKNDKTKCYRFEAESEAEAVDIAAEGGYDHPRQVFMTFRVPKGLSREEAEAMAEAMIEKQAMMVH